MDLICNLNLTPPEMKDLPVEKTLFECLEVSVMCLIVYLLGYSVSFLYYMLIRLRYLLAVLMMEIVDDPHTISKPVLTPLMLIATKHTVPQIDIFALGIS